MSAWTHIVATIDVDTCIEDDNIQKRMHEILKYAPKITGSERDADVFVNVLSGYNTTSIGCDKCEHKTNIKGYLHCDADENFECISKEYQTRVVITIIGNLRDRHIEQTKKEYKEFIKYLGKLNFFIENRTSNIKA